VGLGETTGELTGLKVGSTSGTVVIELLPICGIKEGNGSLLGLGR
jgi:hypothetical protein